MFCTNILFLQSETTYQAPIKVRCDGAFAPATTAVLAWRLKPQCEVQMTILHIFICNTRMCLCIYWIVSLLAPPPPPPPHTHTHTHRSRLTFSAHTAQCFVVTLITCCSGDHCSCQNRYMLLLISYLNYSACITLLKRINFVQ